MSRKQAAEEQPEESVEASPGAGACVLVVLGAGALAGVWAVSPTAAVLTVWVAGAGAVWRWTKIHNPSPPPPAAPSPSAKPQFSVIEDREGHCTVQWHKET